MVNGFLKSLGKLIVIEILYLLFFWIMFSVIPHRAVEVITFLNFNLYFLIFVVIWFSLPFTVANKPLVKLFLLQFLLYAFGPLFLVFVGDEAGFLSDNMANILYIYQYILLNGFNLLVTLFIFIYAVLPGKESKIILRRAVILSLIITTGIYFNIIFSVESLGYENYYDYYQKFFTNNYYINILNFSFLFIVWVYYQQGRFIFSDYLTSILSLFTLVIILEIFHSFNLTSGSHYFTYGQYFNVILNSGLLMLWLIRFRYLMTSEAKENERYVINYELLHGYVEKPRRGILTNLAIRIGRRNLLISAVGLMLILAIPVIALDKQNSFVRLNILILTISLLVLIISGFVYLQRRWFKSIGFLFKK
ncbi:MAG: hypothetical protein AB7T22_09235 [Calditrichaceae bacterium]